MPSGGKTEAAKKLYEMKLKAGEASFMYMGYSGVILRTPSKALAFDVANLVGESEIGGMESLDLLLFTHGHHDHYVPTNTVQIQKKMGAAIAAEPQVFADLKDKIAAEKLHNARPGEDLQVKGIRITPVSGVHAGPVNLYFVDLKDFVVFHGADSGYVPLKNYKADLAFIPTGQPSPTASPEYALKIALDIGPKIAVAVHGSNSQNSLFKRKAEREMPGTRVIVPGTYSPTKIQVK